MKLANTKVKIIQQTILNISGVLTTDLCVLCLVGEYFTENRVVPQGLSHSDKYFPVKDLQKQS